jgi:hypothetical protein
MIHPLTGNELPGYCLGAPLGLITLRQWPYFNTYLGKGEGDIRLKSPI